MRSTKPQEKEDTDDARIGDTCYVTNLEFSGILHKVTPGQIYTDTTGCYTITSSKGTKYFFVLYGDAIC